MNPIVTLIPRVAGGVDRVSAWLADTPAVANADGGWAIVDRPKAKGFTVWEGYSPQTMSLPLMFDGLANNRPQDEYFNKLNRMMRDTVGTSKQPSPVKIYGPVPMTSLTWVIQSVEPDSSSIILGSNGELLRAKVTVSLLEYVEADVLIPVVVRSPAAKVNSKNPPATVGRTHTVKSGDTLWAIAQKYLGAGKRYTEIAKLNGIRDPNRVPIGTVLKIP